MKINERGQYYLTVDSITSRTEYLKTKQMTIEHVLLRTFYVTAAVKANKWC